MITPSLCAVVTRLWLMCEPWPSTKRTTGPDARRWDTDGTKRHLNQSRKLFASIQPLSETPYRAAASPPLVHLSHRFFALYKTNGGNLMPSAEPQPRTVMYSLPDPPPISYTDLASRLASTLVDVASRQRPVSSAFHNLLATSSSDNLSNAFYFKTLCTKSIQ